MRARLPEPDPHDHRARRLLPRLLRRCRRGADGAHVRQPSASSTAGGSRWWPPTPNRVGGSTSGAGTATSASPPGPPGRRRRSTPSTWRARSPTPSGEAGSTPACGASSPTWHPGLAESYDVVSMHHYLEHTHDPGAELDAARTVSNREACCSSRCPTPTRCWPVCSGRGGGVSAAPAPAHAAAAPARAHADGARVHGDRAPPRRGPPARRPHRGHLPGREPPGAAGRRPVARPVDAGPAAAAARRR